MKKKRIAVIGLKGLPAFGGAATVGENIIFKLKRNFDFTVLSVSTHTEKSCTNINGINQIIFNGLNNKSAINTYVYILKCLMHVMFHNYDLIFLHHGSTGFITPFLRLKYKVILTLHGVYNPNETRFGYWQKKMIYLAEKLNLYWANEIISVSDIDRRKILERTKRNIIYIPNGISIQKKSRDNATSSKNIIFAAGRIYHGKGLHLLIAAAQMLSLTNKIIIAGNMDYELSYKTEIFNAYKGLNVDFVGLIKQKKDLLDIVSGSLLFIFPSLYEAMSMMLLEAVSMKTPVIASDIPANRAIFSDDEVLFFLNGDAKDLAIKIEYALSNYDEMIRKAEMAYSKLVKSYTWDIIANDYRKVFENILQKKSV